MIYRIDIVVCDNYLTCRVCRFWTWLLSLFGYEADDGTYEI